MENTASTKQLDFIRSLTKERTPNRAISLDYTRYLAGSPLTTKQASVVISELLSFPRKPAPEGYIERMRREEQEMFEGVENSYYAVPEEVIRLLPAFDKVRELAFFRVYTYKGRRNLRKLTGSVGDFATARLSRDNQRAVLNLLKDMHIEYARLFGENFQRCGRCAAPLTDPESRRTHFGPDCRKVLGL